MVSEVHSTSLLSSLPVRLFYERLRHRLGVLIDNPRQSVLVEHIHKRIRIKLLDIENAVLIPHLIYNKRCTDLAGTPVV